MPATEINSGSTTLNARVLNHEDFDVSECGFLIFDGEPPIGRFVGSLVGEINETDGSFKVTIGAGMKKDAVYHYAGYVISGPLTIFGNYLKYTSEGSGSARIVNFEPTIGHIEDTVIVYLNEKIGDISGLTLQFNNIPATIADFYDNIFRVIVPASLTAQESTIKLLSGTAASESSQKFNLYTPEITSLSDDEVYPGEILTISGINFHAKMAFNIVKFNNIVANVVSNSPAELKVIVPFLENTDCFVSVTIAGQNAVSLESVRILAFPELWKRVTDFPGGKMYKLGSFVIGNYGYVGLGVKFGTGSGYSNKFWRYHPEFDSWIEVASFTGTTRVESHGFSINGIGYIGGGFNYDSPSRITLRDYYKYNPDDNYWSRVSDYPYSINNLFRGKSEVSGGSAYITHSYQDFYSYSPLFDSWTLQPVAANSIYTFCGSFMIDDIIYFIGGQDASYNYKSDVWAFNTRNQTWTRKNDFPGPKRIQTTSFAIGNTGFYGLGASGNTYFKDLWKYNPEYDTWTRTVDFPGVARREAFALIINNMVYIGAGGISSTALTSDVYRLDPELLAR